MKLYESILAFIALVILMLLFFGGLAYTVNSAPEMSDGHRLADQRYRLCIENMKELQLKDDSRTLYFPEKCDGALGQYREKKQ